MAVNGLLSMICASLLMLIEGPSQVCNLHVADFKAVSIS